MLVGAASGVVLLVPLVVGASGVLVGACGVDLVVELLVGDSGVELVVELVVWRSKNSQLINEDSSCPGEEGDTAPFLFLFGELPFANLIIITITM